VVLALGACLAAGLVACPSFDEAPPPGPAPIDGGDSGVAPSGDGGSDATLADAARSPVCTGTVLIDDAFDRSAPLGGGWSSLEGSPAIDPSSGVPMPSLFAPLSAQNTGTSAARVVRLLQRPPARLCIELDLNVQVDPSQFAADAYTEVLALIMPTGRQHLFVQVEDTGIALSNDLSDVPIASFSPGQWTHLALALDYSAASPTVTVTASPSGTTGGEQTTLSAGQTGAPATIEIHLGASSSGKTSAAIVHADNFVVRAP
jgi:hypothetical protein